MELCNYESQVQRFHDGEMDPLTAAAFSAHLPGCSPCTEDLAELRATSALFAGAVRPALSPIGLHRLHHRLAGEMDRGLIRVAGAFSGFAAGVMLLGSAWLLRAPSSSHSAASVPQTPPPWVGVAVSLDTDKLASDVGTPAAQWYLADASHGSDEQP